MRKAYKSLLILCSLSNLLSADQVANKQLILAVQSGSTEQVIQTLAQKADVNALINGTTALHQAIACDYPEIAGILIEHDAQTNIQDRLRSTAFQMAKDIGDIKGQEDTNSLFIFIAALRNDIPSLEFFINHGGTINAPIFTNGNTALHQAVIKNKPDVAMILLRHGSGPFQQNAQGLNAIELAINMAGSEDRTEIDSLFLAIASSAGAEQFVEAFLTKGVPANFQLSNGDTALHQAVFNNHPHAAQKLLMAAGNIDVQNGHGQTPFQIAYNLAHHPSRAYMNTLFLITAANQNNPQIVEHFMRHGAQASLSFQEKNIRGETSIYLKSAIENAIAEDDIDTTAMLLTYGANPHKANRQGKTPFHMVLHNSENKEMQTLFLQHAAQTNNVDAVKASLAHQVNLMKFGANDKTPLMHAAMSGSMESLNLLIEAGVDINQENTSGKTALGLAAQAGQSAIVARLMERGARLVNIFGPHRPAYETDEYSYYLP